MQRFKKILCVVEHGKTSQPALERAVGLAENNQAELMVVDVVPRLSPAIRMPDGSQLSVDIQTAMANEVDARIATLVEPYRERLVIQHTVLMGTPFLEVIRAVVRDGYDLVIKCPESPTWLDRFFSGDDMHLLRKCPCPVWIVKPETSSSYQRVLAAVDVDESCFPNELVTRNELNVQVLELAASLALSDFAELHVAYVWESNYESISGFLMTSESHDTATNNIARERRQHQAWLDAFLRNRGNQATRDALGYLKPKTHVKKGEARKEIPMLAQRLEIDCIVMGTVARTGVSGFIMGNTAETILEQVNCSVLAIKPPGFVTPVRPTED